MATENDPIRDALVKAVQKRVMVRINNYLAQGGDLDAMPLVEWINEELDTGYELIRSTLDGYKSEKRQ